MVNSQIQKPLTQYTKLNRNEAVENCIKRTRTQEPVVSRWLVIRLTSVNVASSTLLPAPICKLQRVQENGNRCQLVTSVSKHLATTEVRATDVSCLHTRVSKHLATTEVRATDVGWLHTSVSKHLATTEVVSAGYTQVFQSVWQRPKSEKPMSASYTHVIQSIWQRPRSEPQMSAGYKRLWKHLATTEVRATGRKSFTALTWVSFGTGMMY